MISGCNGSIQRSEPGLNVQQATVGQHDLRIKALNKGRQTYMYIQRVTQVNLIISIMLQGSSFHVQLTRENKC